MIVLAIIATLAAIVWTIIVLFANGMSDATSGGFQGTGSVYGAWIGVAVIWLAWWFS